MKKLVLALAFLGAAASPALAQSAAPELFGVREVIVDYARFPDAKKADTCGLNREQIAASLAKALAGTGVPAIPVGEARPPALGIARIALVPEVSSYANENLDCISWVSLSAENRANAVIPPIPTQRGVTVVYWRQHTLVASSQTQHQRLVSEIFEKMAGQFAQQFRLDQPPDLPK